MGLPEILLKFAWFVEYLFSSIGGAFAASRRPDGDGRSNATTTLLPNATTTGDASGTSTGGSVLFASLGIGGGVITILALYMLYTGMRQIMRGTSKIAIALFLLAVSSGTLVLVYSHASSTIPVQFVSPEVHDLEIVESAISNFTAS